MHLPAVLFIGTLPPHPGGGASHSALLLSGLDELGHAVSAISPLAAGAGRHDSARLSAGIRVHALPIDEIRIPSKTLDSALVDDECRRMVEIVRTIPADERPDVVLLSRADFKAAALEIAALFDVPLVAIDHGSLSADLDGYFGYAESYRLGRLRDEAACIVSVAEHRAAVLRANGIRNVVAIPNAVDTRHFRPGRPCPHLLEALALPSTSRLIAHVSNMKPLKRIVDYLDSVAAFVGQHADLHVLVVGEGTGRADYEAHARSLGIAERVTFTGWLDHDRLATLYRTVEMIVQPSQVEASPLVILEAIASGCPIVASDIPAIRAILEHDRTAVLVPVGDTHALAQSIQELLDAPDRRQRMAAAARDRWRERTVEKMIARYSAALTLTADSKGVALNSNDAHIRDGEQSRIARS